MSVRMIIAIAIKVSYRDISEYCTYRPGLQLITVTIIIYAVLYLLVLYLHVYYFSICTTLISSSVCAKRQECFVSVPQILFLIEHYPHTAAEDNEIVVDF